MPSEIAAVLKLMIQKEQPEVGLEEWCPSDFGETSAFEAECAKASPPIQWKNIGTPNTPEFKTDHGNRFAGSAYIVGYGPLEAEERREIAMCKNVIAEMSAYQTGLLVIGEAHVHSMSMKLAVEFDVEPYCHFPPA